MSKFSPAFNLGYFQAKINSLDAMLREALTSGREDELKGQYEQAHSFWRELRTLQGQEKDAVGRIVEGSLTASVLPQFISMVNSKTDHATILKELRRLVPPFEAGGMPPTAFKAKGSDAAAADGRDMDHSKPPAPPSSKPARPSSRSDATKPAPTDVPITKVGPPRKKTAPPAAATATHLASPALHAAPLAAPHPPTRPVSEPTSSIRFADLPASETEDWTPDADMGERPTARNPAHKPRKNNAYVEIAVHARPPKRAAEDEDAGPSRKKSKGKGKGKDGVHPWVKVEGQAAPPHPHELMTQSCRDCVKRGWWCLVRKGRVEGACLACQANKRRCSNSAFREKARTVKTEEREVTVPPAKVVRPPSRVKSAKYIEDSDDMGEQREPAPKRQPARQARRQSTAPAQSAVSDGEPPAAGPSTQSARQARRQSIAPAQSGVSDGEPPAAGPSTQSGADKGILTVYDTYRVAAAAISAYDMRISNVEAAATQWREKDESMRQALARSEEREHDLRQIVEKLSTTVAAAEVLEEHPPPTSPRAGRQTQRSIGSRPAVWCGQHGPGGDCGVQRHVHEPGSTLSCPLPTNEAAANPPPAAAIPPPASADSSTPAHTEEPTSQQGHPITPSAPVAATTGETSPSSGSAPEPQPEAAAAPPAPPADVEAPAPPANVEPPPAPAIVEPPPAPTIEPLPAPASVEPPPVQPAAANGVARIALHQLECWTGTFFRPAEMWEVGGVLAIPHCAGKSSCAVMHSSLQRLEDLEGRKDHADQEAAIRLRGVHGEYGTVAHEQASVASGTTMSGMPESGTLMSGMDTMEIQEQSTMDDTVGGSAGVDCGTHPDDPVAGSADPGCGSDLPQSAPRQSSIGEQVGSMDEGDNVDDEDLWEDVEEDDEESGAAEEITENARGSRPSEDDIGNNFVRIVHLNGVHYLPLLHCLCGGEERLHVDLSQARLIPTSFTRIKTLFTCAVLDDYRLSNLEMKASAYQYWQKIVRITSPDGVTQVPDLYRELRRLSREWRWLKKIKWAGFGHENRDPMNPAPGELSIFCPTCPQPGVNLPPDWKADQQRNPEPYTRDMTIDGNFTADHVESKNPGPDLWLSEGGGMMASRVQIEDFMKTAVTRLTVR
ncbi:hypothetical protein LshimejAT787_0402610 [Lyophyllum shimeji]|uniref:CxC2-like cysteine cluster KDZ transposase-associated domain-containing protein n=1 Tax=Lyophyllum shimeji TaxID=47721 RepID=A0A9P3UMW5_LYOSH|nr:hypothetical protein LshimejAT787_0402610 [Lyophyllum shimeji]